MWSDVLNKPKQGLPFRTDRAMLMNIPVNYDDDEERAKTHAKLLPEPAGSEDLALPSLTQPVKASRSVLGNKLLSALGEGPTARNKRVRFAHGCKPGRPDMAGTGAKVSGGKPASQRILLEAVLCLIVLRRNGR